MRTMSERVVIGMDPHKRSATIEVMTADEVIHGGGRFSTDRDGWRIRARNSRPQLSPGLSNQQRSPRIESQLHFVLAIAGMPPHPQLWDMDRGFVVLRDQDRLMDLGNLQAVVPPDGD